LNTCPAERPHLARAIARQLALAQVSPGTPDRTTVPARKTDYRCSAAPASRTTQGGGRPAPAIHSRPQKSPPRSSSRSAEDSSCGPACSMRPAFFTAMQSGLETPLPLVNGDEHKRGPDRACSAFNSRASCFAYSDRALPALVQRSTSDSPPRSRQSHPPLALRRAGNGYRDSFPLRSRLPRSRLCARYRGPPPCP